MKNPTAKIVADLREYADALEAADLDSLPMAATLTFCATDGEADDSLTDTLAAALDLTPYSEVNPHDGLRYRLARTPGYDRFCNGVQVTIQSSGAETEPDAQDAR